MRVLLVIYDNDSYIHWFPQGMAYIAAVLKRSGHDVEIYNQDIHHYPDEHLTRYLDSHRFDAVGLSFVAGYYQYRKALTISEAINRSSQRPLYILGGHGPAPEPEFFLKKTGADVIVMGEGEDTVIELMDAVGAGRSLDGVLGIAYRENGRCVVNERRPLIQDIDAIPFPAYEMFPMETYRLLRLPHCTNGDFIIPILSGRGCTFRCNFCYRMDEGFRPRSSESIVEEIKMLKKNYGITYIAFADELLMSSKKRTIEICEAFLKEDLRIKWDCNGRLNYTTKEVLDVMKQAGCVYINYGIEAFDDEILKVMKKGLTTRQIVRGIEATLEAGITPASNIIFGNIGENRQTLQKGLEFLLQYHAEDAEMRTIRPVTPYPGSDLYYYAIEQGLLKDCRDFYENKHLNSDLLAVNFTELSDEEYYEALLDANSILIRNYYENRMKGTLRQAEDLYCNKNDSFRGFRQS